MPTAEGHALAVLRLDHKSSVHFGLSVKAEPQAESSRTQTKFIQSTLYACHGGKVAQNALTLLTAKTVLSALRGVNLMPKLDSGSSDMFHPCMPNVQTTPYN